MPARKKAAPRKKSRVTAKIDPKQQLADLRASVKSMREVLRGLKADARDAKAAVSAATKEHKAALRLVSKQNTEIARAMKRINKLRGK